MCSGLIPSIKGVQFYFILFFSPEIPALNAKCECSEKLLSSIMASEGDVS